jgi:hypothetical protein
MALLKLWFIRNHVLVSYSICMRQGSSDLSGSQSALACLCVCARAQLGMRELNIHPVTRKEMEYLALMKDPRLQPLWTHDFGTECGRLFQGIRNIPGTDTCFFIGLKNIPKDRKITYGKIVCDYKPHKQEKECVRLAVGGESLRRRHHLNGRYHNI